MKRAGGTGPTAGDPRLRRRTPDRARGLRLGAARLVALARVPQPRGRDWTQTADGVCSSDILLPHGHLEPVRVRRTPLAEAVAALVGGRPPAIRADSAQQRGFDVYVAEDALVYVKAACERVDAETPFYLHLVPAGDDFDEGREAHGFNNLDFMLAWHGDWFGEEGETGLCLAEVPLPDYGIARIVTGQYMQHLGIVWEGEIPPPPTEGA